MRSANALLSVIVSSWLAGIAAGGAVAVAERPRAELSVAPSVAHRVTASAVTAVEPLVSWWRSRDYTAPVLLAIAGLTLVVAAAAFFVAASRRSNGALVSSLLAIGLPCLLTSCNSLFLLGDAFQMTAREAVDYLGVGLAIMSPGLVPIWLGATLHLAAQRAAVQALALILVLAGLGWLLLVYNFVSSGPSPHG